MESALEARKEAEAQAAQERAAAATRGDVDGPRRIVIRSDGNAWVLERCDVTPLELKEICREVINRFGG